MSEWMAWAIIGGVILVAIALALWAGGAHSPGASVQNRAYGGSDDQNIEAARGEAQSHGQTGWSGGGPA
jgi:hypothetical protein